MFAQPNCIIEDNNIFDVTIPNNKFSTGSMHLEVAGMNYHRRELNDTDVDIIVNKYPLLDYLEEEEVGRRAV